MKSLSRLFALVLGAGLLAAIPALGQTSTFTAFVNGAPTATTPLGVTDYFAVTQSGVTKKIAGSRIGNVQFTHYFYATGDSITEGYANGATTDYEATTKSLLNAAGTNYWDVINWGRGGEQSCMIAGRFVSNVVTPGNAEGVAILAGVNDLRNNKTTSEIKACLQAMYTAAHDAGIPVTAITIMPWKNCSVVNCSPPYQWDSAKQAQQDNIRAWILCHDTAGPDCAEDIDYVYDAYTAFGQVGDTEALAAAYDSGDGLHPNNAGLALLGTGVYNIRTWTPSITGTTIYATGPTITIDQSLGRLDDVSFRSLAVDTDGFSNSADAVWPTFSIDPVNHGVGFGITPPASRDITINGVITTRWRSHATSFNSGTQASIGIADYGTGQGSMVFQTCGGSDPCANTLNLEYTNNVGVMNDAPTRRLVISKVATAGSQAETYEIGPGAANVADGAAMVTLRCINRTTNTSIACTNQASEHAWQVNGTSQGMALSTSGLIVQTGTLQLKGSVSGTTEIVQASSASPVLTLPTVTGTLATLAGTETLTNKTISGSDNTLTNIPAANLSGTTLAAGVTASSLVSLGTLTSNLLMSKSTPTIGLTATNNGGTIAINFTGNNTGGTANNWTLGTQIGADDVFEISSATFGGVVMRANKTTGSFTFFAGGLVSGSPTGGAQGSGTVNATGYYANGSAGHTGATCTAWTNGLCTSG